MINIFGVGIFSGDNNDLAVEIGNFLEGHKKTKIAKVNTEFLNRALTDPKFAKTLRGMDFALADGRGVLWAAKYLSLPLTKVPCLRELQAIWQMVYTGASLVLAPKYCQDPIKENCPGVDALILMLRAAAEKKAQVFFFGASQKDLEAGVMKIKQIVPGIKVAGMLNGYDFQKNKNINPISIINDTEAELLIVSLGSPLQEYWIDENMAKLKKIKVAVGEGGSLAFLGGSNRRAPRWMQRIGIEWLWRLFANRSLTHQTGSRFLRVWNAVPVFILRTVGYKIRNGEKI